MKHRSTSLLTVVCMLSATYAVAQTPQQDETAPSTASSPHQREATKTPAHEAQAGGSADASSASSPHQRETTRTTQSAQGAAEMKSVTPESFASQAATISKAEIELAQLALKNSQDASVRQYAERMIKDHTAADQKLKAIAADDNLQLPQSLDQKHASLKKKLQGMSGAEFDREYMKAMAEGHNEAVALFKSASQQQQMPADLKQFASSTLPTLEEHRKMAHSLHGEDGA